MTNLVVIQNKQVVVSSRKIAESFSKRHCDVLRAISKLISSTQKCVQWFCSNKYKDSSGKTNLEYLMNKDGFMLLVMGFTGKTAMDIKIAYINAFNEMEAKLRAIQTPKQIPLIEQVKPTVQYVRPFKNADYMKKLSEVKEYINAARVLTENLTQVRSISEHRGIVKLFEDILFRAGFIADNMAKVELEICNSIE